MRGFESPRSEESGPLLSDVAREWKVFRVATPMPQTQYGLVVPDRDYTPTANLDFIAIIFQRDAAIFAGLRVDDYGRIDFTAERRMVAHNVIAKQSNKRSN